MGWLIGAVLAVAVLLLSVALVRGGGDSPGTKTDPGAPASTTSTAPTAGGTDSQTGLRWVELTALPSQAKDTVALIRKGGPFPFRQDGVVFSNREGVLPDHGRGYYHEYTVVTPGSSTRGARRIVTGDNDSVFFYTDDHYRTFRRVRV